MASGGELIIDNKLLKLLDNVDKKLEKIAKTSGSAQANILKMFDKTGSQGVDGLIRKLQQLEKYYSAIGQNDSRGMKRIANDARKTADEINKLIAAVQQRWTPNFKGAMNYSQNAKTLSQDREAINRLRQARENLSRTDSDYFKKLSQINGAIAVHSSRLRAATKSSHEMSTAHRGLMDISGQLTRKLALVFSVSQVQGYINKLVSVRKEFEMQQRSLQVLLRDKDEANQLWNQTIQLAVQSPFRVKELVTYTKQLAAYRIESEKLHDTTKMLADVSAGLGVDMNRLILAFGQVRAAEFLRGTELRQFTEAGIPMLEELADHFTELEGRAVSTADVFARISKRMVTFEDVEQVFKKVTSEGGTFYRMQEEQSKTLYGMISNLHDSLDLMMNDIGQSNESVLKGAVELTKTLVDNWRAVASVMEVVGTSLAIKGLTLFVRGFRAASAHALLATTNFRGLALAGAKVNGAMKAIHATLMAHPWYAVAAAVLIATKGLYDYNKSIQQHNKKYDDLSKRELSRIDRLKEISKEVENNNATIKDNKSTQEELNKAQLANSKVLEELKKKFPDLYDGLVQQKNGTIELSNAIEAQNALLQINIALQQASKGGWFQQDMETNYTQVYEAQKKMEDSLGKIKIAASNVRLELLNMLSEKRVPQNIASPIQKLVEEIGNSEDLDDATTKWKELSISLQSIYAQGYRLGNLKWNLGGAFVSAHESIIGYDNALKDLYDNLDNGMVRFKEGVEWALSMGGNEAATKWLNTMLMSLGIVDEKIKKEAREYITSKINIKLEFSDDKKEYTEDDLKEEWKKKVWNAIKSVQEANPEIALGVTLKTMVEGDKSSIIPKLQESVKNAIDTTTKDLKGANLDGQVVFTDEQIGNMQASIPLLENLANLIALVRDTKGSGGDKKDWFAEMGRAIRDTHKDFHTLHKDLDVASATYFALAKNAAVFDEAAKNAGVNMSLSDFEDLIKEESVLEALNALLQSIPESASVSRLAIKKMIGEITGDDAVRDMQETAEKLNSQIENMFGTYELSLELKDMNIPTDLAEKLFNFESIDLSGLRQKVLDKLGVVNREGTDAEIVERLKKGGANEERIKLTEDTLKKIAEMEAKALEERMKKYAKFLEQEQTERVKIKLNEVRQLMEIEDTFRIHEKDARETYELTDKQWKAYEEQRKKGKDINLEFLIGLDIEKEKAQAILEQNQLLTAQAQIARAGVTRVTQEDLDKNAWEEFKKSPYYETLFSDLESAGTTSLVLLKERVEDIKKSLKTLPPEIYKQVVEAIDKIDAQLTARNPFRTIFEAWGELRRISKEGVEITKIDAYGRETKARVQSRKDIAKELSTEQTLLETKREEASVIQQILQADTKTRDILTKKNQIALKVLQTTNGNNDALAKELNTTKKVVAVHEENVEKLGREEAKYRSIEAKMDGAKKGIQEWANATTDLIGSVDSLLDSLGLAEDSQTRIWLKASMGIVDTIASVAQLIIQFTLMEVAANSALGIIGYIATALKAIATLFATLFGNPDEGLQKQIEALEVSVEALDRKFQKLEKSIKNAMGVDDINRFTDDAIQNLEDQNKAIGEMIALEEAKKGTDADKIRDWANEMEDNIEEMERLRNERIKELGGIGGAEEIKSAAEEFTDAWLQAFLETGDGLVGLEDQFNDFARNLIKSQLMHRVVESLITPLTTKINEIVDPQNEGGGDITDKEWQELMLLWDRQKEVINERLSSLVEELGGLDSLSSNRDLEGLQKGVQSIQESTAQEIVSYMNSLRALVTQRETFYKNNEQLSSLLDNILTNGINPMLEQMRVIANNTESIHTLLDSVVKAGHREGGYGIKVFSD